MVSVELSGGHLGKGHCDGHPLMPQHGAEPSLPPPSRCGGASVASNESHRHPLFGGNAWLLWLFQTHVNGTRCVCPQPATDQLCGSPRQRRTLDRRGLRKLALNSGTIRRSAKMRKNREKIPSPPSYPLKASRLCAHRNVHHLRQLQRTSTTLSDVLQLRKTQFSTV